MATNSVSHSLVAFLIIFNVFASFAFAGREIPAAAAKTAKSADKKQPESFIGHDGSVLIPGVGRWLFPKPGTHFDPITYNPITGTDGGNGVTIPGLGGSGGSSTGYGYIPGGDDTFVPNPGVEVPAGGSVPVPSSP